MLRSDQDDIEPRPPAEILPRSPVALSAIIITKNESHCIDRCLNSITGLVDEIIVVDARSTDPTVAICCAFGANVSIMDWAGFGPQKNRALALATGTWVLAIDADEHVTPKLAAAIWRAINLPNSPVNGWAIRFVATWCGKPIRFGDWGRKRHLRLFRRTSGRFSDDLLHERVICAPPHGILDGLMIHDTVADVAEAREKSLRYAKISARRLRRKNRGGLWSACAHSTWTFTRGFVLKLGFLDGIAGWQVACAIARGAWLRYYLAAPLPRFRRRWFRSCDRSRTSGAVPTLAHSATSSGADVVLSSQLRLSDRHQEACRRASDRADGARGYDNQDFMRGQPEKNEIGSA